MVTDKKDIYICRCEEVTEKEINKAIEEGARTIRGVKIRTNATMGLCQGRTCRKLIEKILSKETEIAQLNPGIRPPVRAISIGELVGEDKSND